MQKDPRGEAGEVSTLLGARWGDPSTSLLQPQRENRLQTNRFPVRSHRQGRTHPDLQFYFLSSLGDPSKTFRLPWSQGKRLLDEVSSAFGQHWGKHSSPAALASLGRGEVRGKSVRERVNRAWLSVEDSIYRMSVFCASTLGRG